MNWKTEWKYLFWIVAIFIGCFYLPVGTERFDQAVLEGFHLAKSYAREHVLLCLVPAFFIAGAIGVFVSQASVIKYLGAGANKVLAYGVASVSGTILAVCSCTILPLFAGIYKMGAGLGPATAFLYSGPAINALAIILTARILGPQLGIARAVGAIIFSIVIGMSMAVIFRKEEKEKLAIQMATPEEEVVRPLWQTCSPTGENQKKQRVYGQQFLTPNGLSPRYCQCFLDSCSSSGFRCAPGRSCVLLCRWLSLLLCFQTSISLLLPLDLSGFPLLRVLTREKTKNGFHHPGLLQNRFFRCCCSVF
jgi:uncharacterized membrane protein YraQ (UPF0718 family)